MHSLSQRLLLSLGLSLVLVFAVMEILSSQQVDRLTEHMVLSRLEHDSEELLAAMDVDSTGRIVMIEGRIPSMFLRPFSGHYFVIHGGVQTIRSRSLWDEVLAPEQPGVALNMAGPLHQRLLVWTADYRIHGHPVRMTIADNVTELHRMSVSFEWSLLLLSGLALLLLLGLQVVVVRYSLRPLSRLRQDIGRLERGEIEHLAEPGLREIAPLVDGFNQLLQLPGQRLPPSRQSLGDLAHALQTTPPQRLPLPDRRHGTPEDRRRRGGVPWGLRREVRGRRVGVVEDGPAMSEGDWGKAFGAGPRLDEQVPGHGLGLAIVHDLVESYGGSVGLDRSPELGGLRVRVTLPVRATAD